MNSHQRLGRPPSTSAAPSKPRGRAKPADGHLDEVEINTNRALRRAARLV